jgi:hypothetical protein
MSDPTPEESSEEGLSDMEEVPYQESVAGAIYIYTYIYIYIYKYIHIYIYIYIYSAWET